MIGGARVAAFEPTGCDKAGRQPRRALSVISLIATICWATAALGITPTHTLTPEPTATVTPTSCGADPPIVQPVTSPTDLDSQVISATGHVTGARYLAFSSPAGCANPTPSGVGGFHYEGVCQLVPGQLNEISACIINPLCGPSACTRVDSNGAPLDILQTGPTWTPTATPTASPPTVAATATPTETPTGTVTVTPTSCGADPPIVEPVTSPEIFLQQVIVAGGRVTGARYLSFTSPAGCTAPTPRVGTTYAAECQLLPNQVNEIEVCIINAACGDSACTRMDRNGDPLDILTIDVTPTASPTPPPPCSGDCNGDGDVTIDDIMQCVDIALGLTDLGECEACDADGSGQVDITDIIMAVNNALVSCP
jgi:hypothetical protein